MQMRNVLALAGLMNGPANAVELVDRVKANTGADIGIAGSYTMLKRLERDGLVRSRLGGHATATRGGRRLRYYELTADGEAALQLIDLAKGAGHAI